MTTTTMTTGQRRPPSTQPHCCEHLLAGWERVQLMGTTTKWQRNDDEMTKNNGETEKPAHPTAASPCSQGGDSKASECQNRDDEGTTTARARRGRGRGQGDGHHPHDCTPNHAREPLLVGWKRGAAGWGRGDEGTTTGQGDERDVDEDGMTRMRMG